MENSTKDTDGEYVPPGDRLITPADVVELDPNMTVFLIFWTLHIGVISCRNTRVQSDKN